MVFKEGRGRVLGALLAGTGTHTDTHSIWVGGTTERAGLSFQWTRISPECSAYQFRHERNRLPARPNVGHAVDIAVEWIVAGVSIVASASVAGTVAILQFTRGKRDGNKLVTV